jgi:hypothetical protein
VCWASKHFGPFGIEAETCRFTIPGEARGHPLRVYLINYWSDIKIEHAHFGAVLLTHLFPCGALQRFAYQLIETNTYIKSDLGASPFADIESSDK